MRKAILVTALVVAVAVSSVHCDSTVTTHFHQEVDCSDDQLYQVGPRAVSYVTCEAYMNSLGDGCVLGQCCQTTVLGNTFGVIHECDDDPNSDVCSTLEDSSLTACRSSVIDLITQCPDQNPSAICCTTLALWATSCVDTTAIAPSPLNVLCAYRPADAQEYYDDRCGFDACESVDTIVNTFCLDDNECPMDTPSTACCTALRGVTRTNIDCDIPVAHCDVEGDVMYSTLLDKCDEEDPTPTPTIAPSTAPSSSAGGGSESSGTRSASATASPSPISTATLTNRGVRVCDIEFTNTECRGSADRTLCADQPAFASCDEYNIAAARAYSQAAAALNMNAVCGEDECCRLADSSYIWTCEEEDAASHVALSGAVVLALIAMRLF